MLDEVTLRNVIALMNRVPVTGVQEATTLVQVTSSLQAELMLLHKPAALPSSHGNQANVAATHATAENKIVDPTL